MFLKKIVLEGVKKFILVVTGVGIYNLGEIEGNKIEHKIEHPVYLDTFLDFIKIIKSMVDKLLWNINNISLYLSIGNKIFQMIIFILILVIIWNILFFLYYYVKLIFDLILNKIFKVKYTKEYILENVLSSLIMEVEQFIEPKVHRQLTNLEKNNIYILKRELENLKGILKLQNEISTKENVELALLKSKLIFVSNFILNKTFHYQLADKKYNLSDSYNENITKSLLLIDNLITKNKIEELGLQNKKNKKNNLL